METHLNSFETCPNKSRVRAKIIKLFVRQLLTHDKFKARKYLFAPGLRFLTEKALCECLDESRLNGSNITFDFWEKDRQIFDLWTVSRNPNYRTAIANFKKNGIRTANYLGEVDWRNFLNKKFNYFGGWFDFFWGLDENSFNQVHNFFRFLVRDQIIDLLKGESRLFAFTFDQSGTRIPKGERLTWDFFVRKLILLHPLLDVNMVFDESYSNEKSKHRNMRTCAFSIRYRKTGDPTTTTTTTTMKNNPTEKPRATRSKTNQKYIALFNALALSLFPNYEMSRDKGQTSNSPSSGADNFWKIVDKNNESRVVFYVFLSDGRFIVNYEHDFGTNDPATTVPLGSFKTFLDAIAEMFRSLIIYNSDRAGFSAPAPTSTEESFYGDFVSVVGKYKHLSSQAMSGALGGNKFKVPTQLIAGWKRAATVRG